jgi:hypothetical protein
MKNVDIKKKRKKKRANRKIAHARNLKLGVTEIRCKGRKNKIQS